jgi:hypothetical protein
VQDQLAASSPADPAQAAAAHAARWRRALLRALGWSLLAKLLALLLLWWLFFSGRAPPTPADVSRHLHLAALTLQARRDLIHGL